MVGHKAMGAATVGVLLAGLGAAQLLPGGTPLSSTPAQAGELVRYDGCAPLLKAFRDELARTATAYGWGSSGGGIAVDLPVALSEGGATTGGGTTGAAMPAPAVAGESARDAVGNGATGTNLQEKGVDEPDVVKLAGGRLYTISNGALQVLSAGSKPTQLGRLAIPGARGQDDVPDPMVDPAYYGSGQELLVEGDRVLVVDQGYRVTGKLPAPSGSDGGSVSSTSGAPEQLVPPDAGSVPPSGSSSTSGAGSTSGSSATTTGADIASPVAPGVYPGGYTGGGDITTPTTVLRLADVSDPAKPRWIETYELDGSYLSARLVDGSVRLVTRTQPTPTPQPYPDTPVNSQQDAERVQERQTKANRAAAQKLTLAQLLPQATRSQGGRTVGTGAAVQCDDVSYAPAAVGGGLLLVTTLRPGAGLAPVDTAGVQADGDLVYATADRLFVATSRWGTSSSGFAREAQVADEVTTQLHAFDTSDPRALRYVGTGSVDGYVLGRWALSWHEGSMRVATTTGAPWGGTGSTSSSSVVVLREAGARLTEVGRVDGLGKGEQIKAVRYLGDLATVVTFRQTDPLYVLDLSDPTAPALTGQLKVPGFSTYLHPIGDDRLLGIGMEADAQTGRTTGLQASVFDLSDSAKPVQVDRLQLGDGYSEALQESRAFGYDPQRGLAVLPFQDGRGASSGLGIRVAADGRLTLAGKLVVTESSGQDCGLKEQPVAPETSCGYAGGAQVRRVVLDGDRVHVLTDRSLVTGTSAGFDRTSSLGLD
jgi:hypothetical protein